MIWAEPMTAPHETTIVHEIAGSTNRSFGVTVGGILIVIAISIAVPALASDAGADFGGASISGRADLGLGGASAGVGPGIDWIDEAGGSVESGESHGSTEHWGPGALESDSAYAGGGASAEGIVGAARGFLGRSSVPTGEKRRRRKQQRRQREHGIGLAREVGLSGKLRRQKQQRQREHGIGLPGEVGLSGAIGLSGKLRSQKQQRQREYGIGLPGEVGLPGEIRGHKQQRQRRHGIGLPRKLRSQKQQRQREARHRALKETPEPRATAAKGARHRALKETPEPRATAAKGARHRALKETPEPRATAAKGARYRARMGSWALR